eukprot:g3910.t1
MPEVAVAAVPHVVEVLPLVQPPHEPAPPVEIGFDGRPPFDPDTTLPTARSVAYPRRAACRLAFPSSCLVSGLSLAAGAEDSAVCSACGGAVHAAFLSPADADALASGGDDARAAWLCPLCRADQRANLAHEQQYRDAKAQEWHERRLAPVVQSCWRGMVAQRRLQRITRGMARLQSVCRGAQARTALWARLGAVARPYLIRAVRAHGLRLGEGRSAAHLNAAVSIGVVAAGDCTHVCAFCTPPRAHSADPCWVPGGAQSAARASRGSSQGAQPVPAPRRRQSVTAASYAAQRAAGIGADASDGAAGHGYFLVPGTASSVSLVFTVTNEPPGGRGRSEFLGQALLRLGTPPERRLRDRGCREALALGPLLVPARFSNGLTQRLSCAGGAGAGRVVVEVVPAPWLHSHCGSLLLLAGRAGSEGEGSCESTPAPGLRQRGRKVWAVLWRSSLLLYQRAGDAEPKQRIPLAARDVAVELPPARVAPGARARVPVVTVTMSTARLRLQAPSHETYGRWATKLRFVLEHVVRGAVHPHYPRGAERRACVHEA